MINRVYFFLYYILKNSVDQISIFARGHNWARADTLMSYQGSLERNQLAPTV